MSGSGAASLSFQIDSSQAQDGSKNLDQLSASADKVRASTRFMVSTFGDANTALTELATSGRASLASFEQISQNLDLVTQRLQAMRTAVADTVGMLGNQGLSSSLTTFQQQFDSMAQLFGTSAAQLEKFNLQAQQLGMNSYQLTSALQRISDAQQNLTPGGQAIRQALNMEGISVSNDPSQVLQQVLAYASTHQQSQQAMQDLQLLLGPLDPATYARVTHQPYFTVAERQQISNQNTLGVESSRLADQVAQGQWQLSQENATNQDASRYFFTGWTDLGLGVGTERQRMLDRMQQSIQEDQRSGDRAKLRQDQEDYRQLLLAGAGSEQAMAAEGGWATNHWNEPNIPLWRTPRGIWQSWLEPDKNGQASWLSRVLDTNLARQNAQVMRQQYQEDLSRTGPFDLAARFRLGIGEDYSALQNLLGLYHTPTDQQHQIDEVQAAIRGDQSQLAGVHDMGRYRMAPAGNRPAIEADLAERQQQLAALRSEKPPVGANEQYFMDQSGAQIAQQLGYGGFSEVLAARANLANVSDTGENSFGDKLKRQFGSQEGAAILQQMAARQRFVAGVNPDGTIAAYSAATPGFDQLQALRAQGFMSSQVTGSGEAQVLGDYFKSLGLDPGRWQEAGLSMKDVISGRGPADAVLTPGQRSAFNDIWGQYRANEAAGLNTSFQQQEMLYNGMPGQPGLTSLANSNVGTGEYQAQQERIRAYQQELIKTGDAALAASAGQKAYTEALQANAAQADRATQAMKQRNDAADAVNAAGQAALTGNAPGASDAAIASANIAAQMAQWRLDNPTANAAAHEQELRRQIEAPLVANMQSAASQIFDQLSQRGTLLSDFGSPLGQRNRDEVQAQYAGELAQATGNYKDQMEQLVDVIARFKTTVDETNQVMSDLQHSISSEQRASIVRAAMKLPTGDQQSFIAEHTARVEVASLTQPTYGIDQHGLAIIGPLEDKARQFASHGPTASGAAIPFGAVPRNNPLNLTFAGQPGAIGFDPNNNVADFDTPQHGEAADIHQLSLDIGRGKNTVSTLIPAWATTAPHRRQSGYISGVTSYIRQHGFPNFSSTSQIDTTNSALMRALLGGMAGQEGPDPGRARSFPDPNGDTTLASETDYQSALQTLQAGNITQSTAFQNDVLQRQMPYLLTGNTAAARMVGAQMPSPATPSLEQAAQVNAQLASVTRDLQQAAANLSASSKTALGNDQQLAAAYPGGPDQVMRTQARIQAEGQARTSNPYMPGTQAYDEWTSNQAAQNYSVARANAENGISQQALSESMRNALKIAEYNNQFIVSPYARTLADAQAQAKNTLQQANVDPNSAAGQQYLQQTAEAAQLQVNQMHMSDIQQNMNQVGGGVSNFLSNAAFSYQHGPGAGVYLRQQLAGLFDQAGRSLFKTAIGDPIQQSVTGNLTDLVGSILGYAPQSSGGGNASPNGISSQGGGSSAASNTIGGIGGMIQGGIFNHLMSGMFDGLLGGQLMGLGNSVTPGIASAIASGSAGALPATPAAAAVGLLPRIGGWLTSLFSAQGNVFSNGGHVPFASGGVFDGPTTMPMAMLGEAGPEAIMPLRRGADGRLGVVAGNQSGSGGGNGGYSIHINAPITVGANATGPNGQMSQHQQAQMQRQFNAVFETGVKKVMAQQSRPGGMIQPQQA